MDSLGGDSNPGAPIAALHELAPSVPVWSFATWVSWNWVFWNLIFQNSEETQREQGQAAQ